MKVFRIENFDPQRDHKEEFRRGFVIPFKGIKGKVLFVTEGSLDHERLADKFCTLTDEQIKETIMEQGIENEEDFNSAFLAIEKIREDYNQLKTKYPSSRKDFLLYEEDAIAFDSASYFGKSILYRDSGASFRISKETEKIAYGYMMNKWKGKAVPDNPLVADSGEFNPWEKY